MDKEKVLEIARECGLAGDLCFMFNTGNDVYAFATAIYDATREECAKLLDDAAIRLYSGRARVNQVDRHVSGVLRDKAAAIRNMGKEG